MTRWSLNGAEREFGNVIAFRSVYNSTPIAAQSNAAQADLACTFF
jgi:hypothetical protein